MIELEDIKALLPAAFATGVFVVVIAVLFALIFDSISLTPINPNIGLILGIVSLFFGFWALFILKGCGGA